MVCCSIYRYRLEEPRVYCVGDSAEFTKVFSEEDVLLFAGITGDRNPVHTSKEFAEKTRFKKQIAHGLLTAGTISAAIGMKLPGPGCLYLSQTLEFKAPVFPGDEITARVEIVEVISQKRLRMKTSCFNQDKVLVIDGEAIIVPPRQRGEAARTNRTCTSESSG
jgi:3-hydroxybutyryl-CoA dehydratase